MKRLTITVNGVPYDVQVEEANGSTPVATAPKAAPAAPVAAAPAAATKAAPEASAAPAADAEVISAPMPGNILDIKVKAGDQIKKGDVLLILEAMKMENEIMAPHDAVVAGVHVNKGDSVESGKALVSLK